MTEPTPPGQDPGQAQNPRELRSPQAFRWQAFFQRSTDALFLLDGQRRLRFANRAWEALTGLASVEVRLLSCKRQNPASPGEALPDVLAHALAPPPEVLHGRTGRARRRLPGGDARGNRWWDVEFIPLQIGDRPGGILGRIRPFAEEIVHDAHLPEKLVDLRERAVRRFNFTLFDSTLPIMRRLVEQARLAACNAAPVLICGEPGTGKETLARVIHYQSARREQSFATIDCARLPPVALAEVLFGERARTGAIYLREVGRLPRDLQLRLCAALNSEAGPRVLASCQGPPECEVRDGRLLPDLFAAFPLLITVPPLRERGADLPAVLQRVLERVNESNSTPAPTLSNEVREILLAHAWKGNLRELFDVLSHARRHASDTQIEVADLPASLRLCHAAGPAPAQERSLPLDSLLEQAERNLIELALRRSKGHRGKAAEILGIWRARLIRRIEALGIGAPETEETES